MLNLIEHARARLHKRQNVGRYDGKQYLPCVNVKVLDRYAQNSKNDRKNRHYFQGASQRTKIYGIQRQTYQVYD